MEQTFLNIFALIEQKRNDDVINADPYTFWRGRELELIGYFV